MVNRRVGEGEDGKNEIRRGGEKNTIDMNFSTSHNYIAWKLFSVSSRNPYEIAVST